MSPDSATPTGPEAALARLGGLHPKIIDLSLGRIERLLAALGRPQDALPPVVHVAGTNGKGSTIAFLRAMLEAAGLSVHVYTSPHLIRFSERIVVAGREIDDVALASVLQECEDANAGAAITVFEITTAAAMLVFARASADVTLLETGLGGRLDATNVVARPAITAITPVSLDHQAFLGDTLRHIAFEKAGILKAGVPCVVSAQEPDAAAVIRSRAAALGVPLMEEGSSWRVEAAASGGLRFQSADTALTLPAPRLKGAYQTRNAGTAIACALHLRQILSLDAVAIQRGIAAARWPARLQQLERGSLAALLPAGWELWLDGGHNPGAAQALARQLGAWGDRPVHAVFGMLRSKDAGAFLATLAPHLCCLAAVRIPGEQGSLDAAEAAAIARRQGIRASAVEDIAGALRHVAGAADAADAGSARARVLICGSLYLAGAVLALNRGDDGDDG